MDQEEDSLHYYPEPDPAVDALIKRVIGAAIEVHRHLGPGFLESVYGEAFAIELRLRGIAFVRQVEIGVTYKGHRIGKGFLDFLIEGNLVVELKACDALAPIHRAQVISYLKQTGHKIALLINFNVPILKEGIKRIILSS